MMSEEMRKSVSERKKKYWEEVRAGKRVHNSPGRKKVEPVEQAVEPVEAVATEPEPEAVVEPTPVTPPVTAPPQKQPETARSPMAHAEGIHFPMPGVKRELSFMVDKQQPVEQKPRHVDPPPIPPKHPGLKKAFDRYEQENENRQIVADPNLNIGSKVIVAVGRKVAVKFEPPQQSGPSKVIVAMGRRKRPPGDL